MIRGAKRVLRVRVVMGLFLCALLCSQTSFALVSEDATITYDFRLFSDNGDWGTSGSMFGDSEFNITMDVSKNVLPTRETVNFVFHNNSGPAMGSVSITDIYFDDGTLLGISNVFNGTGVSFSRNATPGDLPDRSLLDPDFETTTGFSADSDSGPPGVSANGIQSGEELTILFDLRSGGLLSDIIRELNNGTLRIGLHVQSFPDGNSNVMVNVPEPASLMLLGLGSLVLARRRRR